MSVNRLQGFFAGQDEESAVGSAAVPEVGAAFVVCPLTFAPGSWQQQLYQSAFERARAALVHGQAASRRDNLIVWN